MSEILKLAQDLKVQSEKTSNDILKAQNKELEKLEKRLAKLYESRLNTIEQDTQKRIRSWTLYRTLIPLSLGLSLSLGAFLGAQGLMSYYSKQISELQATVSQLEARGGLAKLSTCDGRLCVQVWGDQYQDQAGNKLMIIKGY